MTDFPNIATTRQRCDVICWYQAPRGEIGDVRRCEHGTVWRLYVHTLGGAKWDRLSWFWTPIDMFRARRALSREPHPDQGGVR